ncbi:MULTISPECIES: hypothetical protein [Bombella]|uniref:Farnesoic acid O-methyl transferase domain-containing protein n=1 Tax=Bombella pollinis TaxID=2967337 RepID=A0ABT3WL27_9PROT|nr:MULTISPECIES: hypothetical protein [Bombella]MCX5619820.1 hypothetical protein [Bombella pollinis]MUG04529.1 hypothetical protein [Bombella sp. ESL0378]
MTKRKILVTFAGREDRMGLLRKHISSLLDAGLLDEWHVWDFTRTEKDRAYISSHYGPACFLRPEAGYHSVGMIERGAGRDVAFMAASDVHVAIKTAGHDQFLEYVIGGWQNRGSMIRQLEGAAFSTYERQAGQCLHQASTPSVLCGQLKDKLRIHLSDEGALQLGVSAYQFPEVPLRGDIGEVEVFIRGGFGSSVELPEVTGPIRRFIGDRGCQKPYWQAYQYYVERYEAYKEAIFLKCDDDIIYLQEDRIADFIRCIEERTDKFLISANVVNNGVCAYLQQQAGHLPQALGAFEHPEGGFGGSLWQDGQKAYDVHRYFVTQGKPAFPLGEALMDVEARLSINFIGWRGEMLRYMQITPQDDDEHMLSVVLPRFLGKKVAIFSDFMVSHLSFFPQEDAVKADEIIKLYDTA